MSPPEKPRRLIGTEKPETHAPRRFGCSWLKAPTVTRPELFQVGAQHPKRSRFRNRRLPIGTRLHQGIQKSHLPRLLVTASLRRNHGLRLLVRHGSKPSTRTATAKISHHTGQMEQ